MQGVRLFGQELLDIVRNRKVLVSVIGILFIPIMYSGMLVGSFWDPYGRTGDLPVAVVNEDAGAVLEGKQLALGNELIDNLKDNDKFKWAYVSRDEAEKGLMDGRYYLALEIPADFSKQATTLLDDEPKPSSLVYVTNESLSFTASKIGNAAVQELKASLSKEVTKSYAETMFEQLGKVASGFADASDGASKLHDGAAKAKDGAATLHRNLAKLADGTLGLTSGVKQLADGTAKVSDGASKLSSGASGLADGLKQLGEAAGKLGTGAKQASDAGAKLAAGAKSAQEAEAKLADGAAKLAAGLEAYASAASAAGGADQAAPDEALQQLIAAAKAVAAGADQLAAGGGQLAGGASELQQGQAALLQGLTAFEAKLEGAAAGGAQLSGAAKTLAAGAKQAADGAAAANAGASALASGSGQLADGSAALTNGVGQLADGSAELADKLGEASRQSNVTGDKEQQADMFAAPVEVSEKKLTTVPNYGTGFAPYSLSLGLFVGALLSTIVLPMRGSAGRPRGGGSWFASKALLFVLVGVIQALIADAILLYGIGLGVQSVGWFVALSIVTSLTFMMIIQFIVTMLDQPGRFIAIIILILQLTSSSGTYPKELVPVWLQHVGDWMPMTYAVSGFKAVISSGDFGLVRSSIGTLGIYAVAFAALSLVLFVAMHKRRPKDATGSGMTAPAAPTTSA